MTISERAQSDHLPQSAGEASDKHYPLESVINKCGCYAAFRTRMCDQSRLACERMWNWIWLLRKLDDRLLSPRGPASHNYAPRSYYLAGVYAVRMS
jgi:hypothetical protein